MDKGSITSWGVEKYPFCHCYQRGRIRSKTQLKIRGFIMLPSIPKGDNVGLGVMVFSLMSNLRH
jgi:hypothetical protein